MAETKTASSKFTLVKADDKKHLLLGEIGVYLHYYVYADLERIRDMPEELKDAFSIQVDLRVLGIEVASSGRVVIENGTTLQVTVSKKTAKGKIEEWSSMTGTAAIQGSNWEKADTLHFHLIGLEDDTVISFADLVGIQALSEVLEPLKAIMPYLMILRIPLNLGYASITLPIERDSKGKIMAVNKVRLPQQSVKASSPASVS